MKCRQCGHLIEINEAVTGNVGPSLGPSLRPKELGEGASAGDGGAPLRSTGPDREAVESQAVVGRAAVKAPAKPGPSTVQVGRKPSNAGIPATRSAEKDRSRPVATPIPRAAAPQATGTRPAVPPKPAASLVAQAPRAAEKIKTASKVALRNQPVAPDARALPPGTAIGNTGALAGAFTKAVSQSFDSASEEDHPLAGDEWYIGINDVPIGPIRLAEIRDRAAQGEVTQECLVWRDGFEDWKPLSAFPELVAVVEDGLSNFRSPRAAPTLSESVHPPKDGTVARLHAASEPVAPAPVPVAAAPIVLDEAVLAAAGLRRQKIPLAAWLAVAAALALGVTLGLVLIKPEPPKQVIKYIEVPAKSKQSEDDGSRGPSVDNSPPSGEAAVGEQVAAQKQNTPRRAPAQGASETAASTSPSEISQGLKGLQGLQAGGPRTGPASEPGAASGARQQLDSATLSRTVSRYTASVKRSCWQPALDARAPDAATSARISANIVVAPSGKVQTVTVSPDPKGYRGLSNCIQARVRNWEFPPAGGPTEFNVPFVFAAQ